MIETSIIILNYNTTRYIDNLICSIEKYLDLNLFEIIVVDNHSSDKSFRLLKNKYSFINIVENEKNLGFAAGNNSAIKYTSGKYLLFLNPDITLVDNNIVLLICFLNSNKDTGIVSGMMVDKNNIPLYFYNDFLNVKWEIFQLLGFGYSQKIKKLLSRSEIMDNKQFDIDWFHGAFILISKKNFELINGFNESHFMYFEDMELCYNIKKKLNLRNVCLPDVKYIHETRSTFSNTKYDDLYFFHINRGKLIFIKNYYFFHRIILKLISLIGIVLRIIFLPVWNKYRGRKTEKFLQLLKIVRLHFSDIYLDSSKYEYTNK